MAEEEIQFCSTCGKKLISDAKFCHVCGETLEVKEKQEIVAEKIKDVEYFFEGKVIPAFLFDSKSIKTNVVIHDGKMIIKKKIKNILGKQRDEEENLLVKDIASIDFKSIFIDSYLELIGAALFFVLSFANPAFLGAVIVFLWWGILYLPRVVVTDNQGKEHTIIAKKVVALQFIENVTNHKNKE